MHRAEKVELTVAVMVTDSTGRILGLDRNDPQFGGLYFPGGHIEPGESAVRAAIREVQEETGLTVNDPVLCGMKQFPTDDGRYIVLLFRADRFSGELSDSREGHVFWVYKKDLPSYRLSEYFEETIALMENDNLSEFFWSREAGGWKKELL